MGKYSGVPDVTTLTPAQEIAYQRWLETNKLTKKDGFNVDDRGNGLDYDLRGYFKKYGAQGLSKSGQDGIHFTDEFKLPNHETFSDESVYADPFDKRKQGSWNGDTYTSQDGIERPESNQPDPTNTVVPEQIVDKTQNVTPMENINVPINTNTLGNSKYNIQPAVDDLRVNPATPRQTMMDKLFPDGVGLKNIYDLGRLGVGLSGALQKTPEWQRPANWNKYVQDSQRMSTQGFSPEEYSLAKNNANNNYAYDISNINNQGGGNAGTILGNYGRAASSLYHNNAELAAQDAALRRQNFNQYGNVLGKDVGYDRQIYEDKLAGIMRNKQSGAQLANSAITQLSGRADLNDLYGKNSTYNKYMQGVLKTQSDEDKLREIALAKRANEGAGALPVTPTTPLVPNSPAYTGNKYYKTNYDFANNPDYR